MDAKEDWLLKNYDDLINNFIDEHLDEWNDFLDWEWKHRRS